MSKYKIVCKDHGVHEWKEDVFMCRECGRLFHINDLSYALFFGKEPKDDLKCCGIGETCTCGAVLFPVPWRLNASFAAVPGCRFCYAMTQKKIYKGKNMIDIMPENFEEKQDDIARLVLKFSIEERYIDDEELLCPLVDNGKNPLTIVERDNIELILRHKEKVIFTETCTHKNYFETKVSMINKIYKLYKEGKLD